MNGCITRKLDQTVLFMLPATQGQDFLIAISTFDNEDLPMSHGSCASLSCGGYWVPTEAIMGDSGVLTECQGVIKQVDEN